MTVIVDDAGSGDLLFGVVIGVYRQETNHFKYDILDVRFYQEKFKEKEYLQESSRIVSKIVAAFNPEPDEEIHICQGCIFDVAAENLRKVYGEDRVKRIHVEGEAQRLIEIAYLDEIRNLGYDPLAERDEKRGKNFFHMIRWLKDNPKMLRYAKTGWPKLKKYPIFQKFHTSARSESVQICKAVCVDCGSDCEAPFQPKTDKPVYCQKCWQQHKPNKTSKRRNKTKNKKK